MNTENASSHVDQPHPPSHEGVQGIGAGEKRIDHMSATVVAASVGIDAKKETPEGLHAKVGEYFDTHIVSPYVTKTEEATKNLQRYKSTFTETAVELFGPRVVDETNKGEYNPRLSELAGILTSVDHNAGVYYSKDDVQGIFDVVAREIFDDEETKQRLANDATKPYVAIEERAAKVTSLDREIALPLVKDASGEWRVAGPKEYGKVNDFTPLEVLREDNADKGGWNKYRFRAPTYTRQQDSVHTKRVADGWYTSEWYREPNYWSAQVRSMFAATAVELEHQLADTGISATFVTEGGIFKGTTTAGTDFDTYCLVSCGSPADFAKANEVVGKQIANHLESIPFDTKQGPGFGVALSFFDRSTGKQYYRNDEGEFKVLEERYRDVTTKDNAFITHVRQHEKGLMITTARGVTLFRKPKIHDNKDVVYVSIEADTGIVHTTDKPIAPPRPAVAPAARYSEELDWV